jgi:hypothetical protein
LHDGDLGLNPVLGASISLDKKWQPIDGYRKFHLNEKTTLTYSDSQAGSIRETTYFM